MPYLADTNILLRLLQRGDANHATVVSALRALYRQGERIYSDISAVHPRDV